MRLEYLLAFDWSWQYCMKRAEISTYLNNTEDAVYLSKKAWKQARKEESVEGCKTAADNLFMLGYAEKATNLYAKLLRLENVRNDWQACLYVGNILYENNRKDFRFRTDAFTAYKKAIKSAKRNKDENGMYALAQVYSKAGGKKKAKKLCRKGLRMAIKKADLDAVMKGIDCYNSL